VNRIAPVGEDFLSVDEFRLLGSRLEILSRHTADPDDRGSRGVGEDDAHLQEDLEAVGNPAGAAVGKALDAVPTVEDEGTALRRVNEGGGEVVHLPGEDERGKVADLLEDGGQRCRVAVEDLVRCRMVVPRRGVHGRECTPGFAGVLR
jgi:hypothetical protein